MAQQLTTYSISNAFDTADYTSSINLLRRNETALEKVKQAVRFLNETQTNAGTFTNKKIGEVYQFIGRVRGEDQKIGKNKAIISTGRAFLLCVRLYLYNNGKPAVEDESLKLFHAHNGKYSLRSTFLEGKWPLIKTFYEGENIVLSRLFHYHNGGKNSDQKRVIENTLAEWPLNLIEAVCGNLIEAVCGKLIAGDGPSDPQFNEELIAGDGPLDPQFNEEDLLNTRPSKRRRLSIQCK